MAWGNTSGQVQLKDGSRFWGEILDMTNGVLTVRVDFSDGAPIPIQWDKVVGLKTWESLTLVLDTGVKLKGNVQLGEPEIMMLQTDFQDILLPIEMTRVVSINQPLKPVVRFSGNLNGGASVATGNTDLRQVNVTGEFVARSERLRLTLLGRWIYSEDDGDLFARNTFGNVKMDFFLTERLYAFTSVLLEQDTFQELQLRTAINAGPGYQFIEKGDYAGASFEKMELNGELGLGFLNEDFKVAEDRNFFAGRWALDFKWPVSSVVTIFHQHQGFPSFEKTKDFYLTSQQGVRVHLLKNFISTLQVNWRFQNQPTSGNKKSDFQYLLTVGYSFES